MGDWVKSWKSLRDNPKTDLAGEKLEQLGGEPDWSALALGHLHLLWWWASDHAQDGDLSEFTNRQIARACRWSGDADAFVEVMIAAGFIDADRTIHHWRKYNGSLIEKWEKDAARKRGERVSTGQSTGRSNGRGADSRQDVQRRKIDRDVVSYETTSSYTAEDRLCALARKTIPGWKPRTTDTKIFATLLATWPEEQVAETINRLAAHQATTEQYDDPRRALGNWLKRVKPAAPVRTKSDVAVWSYRKRLAWGRVVGYDMGPMWYRGLAGEDQATFDEVYAIWEDGKLTRDLVESWT